MASASRSSAVARRKCSKADLDGSLEEDNFSWAFNLNKISLELIGIWPSDEAHKYDGVEEKEDIVVRCDEFKEMRIPMMVLWMLLGLLLPQIYALSLVFRELPLVVDNFTTSCTTFTGSVNLFLLWHGRRVLELVVNRVRIDWRCPRPSWETAVMAKQASRARFFTISGYAMMFACFFGFLASPMFGSIRIVNNITDPGGMDGQRFFPLQTYYPYDSERSPYFEITYFSQILGGIFVGIAFSVPDNFYSALIFHACAQCEILRLKMSQVLLNDPHLVARYAGNEGKLLRLKLRRYVSKHVKLINFVSAVEQTFNKLILVQVVCLSMIVCCLGFGVIRMIGNTTERPPIVQIVILTGTVLSFMIHMLVYCTASEILADHSLGIAQAIYSSAWYLLPATCARDVMLVMVRSKYPLKLTAGKFFDLSLNAYLKIVRSSIGYISMLLAVSK